MKKIKFLNEKILLAHGSGGRLTHELINTFFKNSFSNPALDSMDDAAAIKSSFVKGGTLAFTTDSFVVNPIFFPGGDIGKLSICGTVNDLAMKGAVPAGISVAAIIEEGFSFDSLKKIVSSIAKTAKEAGVDIVTGDTKVVEKGKADQLFLTTSGVGIIPSGIDISGSNAKAGDSILINGTIGDHGIAVLTARNEFKLNSKSIKTDCAPLNKIINKLSSTYKDIHVLRDPTRGGVATTLNEIAISSNKGIIIDENAIPVKKEVRAVCDILGFDPLYVANEGKFICFVPEKLSPLILKTMRLDKYGRDSSVIGRVVDSPKGVWLKTFAGGMRPLIMLEGDQLPRIC